MQNWFHALKGKYDQRDQWIGLDYSRLFLDPLEAEATLAHEMVHFVLGIQTEFGQASHLLWKVKDYFSVDIKKNTDTLLGKFYHGQFNVQEGFATALQFERIRAKTGLANALEWATHLPGEPSHNYLAAFNELGFFIKMSKKHRDFFMNKVSNIALQTTIRQAMVEGDFLTHPERFVEYWRDDQNRPDARLKMMLDKLRRYPWMVTKGNQEIAQFCGVVLLEPPTKQEVAEFLTYISAFTGSDRVYMAEDINEAPQGIDAISQGLETVVIANQNINLAENGIMLWELKDIQHYSDVIKLIYIHPFGSRKEVGDIFTEKTGKNPEVSIIAFAKSGEKYMYVTTRDEAKQLIENELSGVTLMVNAGDYNVQYGAMVWFTGLRKPDVVLCNSQPMFNTTFSSIIEHRPESAFELTILLAKKDHPIRTVLIREKLTPDVLYVHNSLGQPQSLELIEKLKRGREEVDLLTVDPSTAEHVNNLMSAWMGLNWDIDWVRSWKADDLISR